MDLHQRLADFGHLHEHVLGLRDGRLRPAQLIHTQADDEGNDQRNDAEHHAHDDVELAVFLIEHVLHSLEKMNPTIGSLRF